MTFRILSPFLLMALLAFSLPCQAQDGVHCDLLIKESAIDNSDIGIVKHIHKGEFIFRKMSKSWRVLAFTPEDAQAISDYFFNENQVVACHTHYLDKRVKVFAEKRENAEPFPFKQHIDALQEMGYFITSFHKSEDIVVFPMQNCNAAFSIHEFDEGVAVYLECPPCSQVTVKNKQEAEEEDLIKVHDFPASTEEESDLLEMKDSFQVEEAAESKVKVSQPRTEEMGKKAEDTSLTQKDSEMPAAENSLKADTGSDPIMETDINTGIDNSFTGSESSTAPTDKAAILEIMQLSEKHTPITEEDMKETEEMIELPKERASELEVEKETEISEVDLKEKKEDMKLEIMKLSQDRLLILEEKENLEEPKEDVKKKQEEKDIILEIMQLSKNRKPIIEEEKSKSEKGKEKIEDKKEDTEIKSDDNSKEKDNS